MTQPTFRVPTSDEGQEPDTLTPLDRHVLAFERGWWKTRGAKEAAIKAEFDLSATRYYQLLNTLLDRPEALAHDPVLVTRLRRLQAQRQRARSARHLRTG